MRQERGGAAGAVRQELGGARRLAEIWRHCHPRGESPLGRRMCRFISDHQSSTPDALFGNRPSAPRQIRAETALSHVKPCRCTHSSR